MLHKMKLIQFLGRNSPIVLQNDNGPCPLLAICNVLSLRNNLNLNLDLAEISQEKLLALVAERLIDSNSNVNNKDAGYIENQQQNIADAIDLLSRLTTGIDVNLKFTRIDDFEFTRECAIFDLLGISLYHGWIVDPQDVETSGAIGTKSYNTLMGELVALDTHNPSTDLNTTEEDSVDFVAATTATLGVPSPSLSRVKSFDGPPHSVSEDKKGRKGDLEEEEGLLRALKLSETANDVNFVENIPLESSNEPVISREVREVHTGAENDDSNTMKNDGDDLLAFETAPVQYVSPSSQELNDKIEVLPTEKHECKDEIDKDSVDALVQSEKAAKGSDELDLPLTISTPVHNSGDEKVQDQSVSSDDVNSESSKVIAQPVDESKCLSSSDDVGSEPIYEGEEHIKETSTANFENEEPMYEGEVVLAEQVEKDDSNTDESKGKDGITPRQGELIRNFLKNSASQLTIYGLFSLQESIKERELCVFFRNNHFNTMFKFEGELYLLATDQGYINQPDLVWEKLNEVNGDTLYMTGSFKEFNPENPPETRPWDEQNALTNTADYLASIDNTAQENTDFNSDLQLAIALQQQEFEQQQQPPQPQHNSSRPNISRESGLVTGPQHVQPSKPRNSSSSHKQESKSSKDNKCIVM
ncbi:uncharacterized protein [Rutidosis leptorrhynchoides]|uniref:uncharacterized protein n=1 Tax=Rutidosis leptorrhynchoides TaxID=125765 RepID=UPI003A9A33B4